MRITLPNESLDSLEGILVDVVMKSFTGSLFREVAAQVPMKTEKPVCW